MGKVLAPRSVVEDKLRGKDVLGYLNYGEGATEASPVWALIGGQRNVNLSMSADELDASNKGSGGWGETYSGTRKTELSMEMIVNTSDDGYKAMKKAFVEDLPVDVCRYAADGTADRNWYNIKEFSDETPHDDMVTVTVTLGGLGKPRFYENLTSINDVVGLISSNSESRITVSKAAAADVVITVTNGGTITGLKKGSSSVASTNYSIAAGGKSIVIDSTYLAGLDTGEETFEVQVSGGENVTYVVTITA